MNSLDKLPQVYRAEEYIGLAFGRAKKRIEEIRKKGRGGENWFKIAEITRIDIAGSILYDRLNEIWEKFPKIDDFSDFKKKLLGCFINIDEYKKGLARIRRSKEIIKRIQREIIKKIKRTEKPSESAALRKEAFGRFASIIKRLDRAFERLEEYRKSMKNVPLVREELYTVCIAGFPNVGKSTLMKKLTGANVEINTYSFTTKQLLINYIKEREQFIQIIDTPGTLNRREKMNLIEKQADLAIRELAHLIIFVYDPLSDSKKQDELLLKMIKLGKKIHVYMSKTDLLSKREYPQKIEKISRLLRNNNKKDILILTKPAEVKEEIIRSFKNWQTKNNKNKG